ncbi:MAG: ABC transporter substrate-binding protein [Gammaproteobacteria bacterium]|nr:ABC transporter substrate-binding protein [Gammaproteobacteria bacterium]
MLAIAAAFLGGASPAQDGPGDPAPEETAPAAQPGAAAGPAPALEAESPEQVVEALHGALVDAAAELGDADLDARYAELEPVVEATHDLPYIAQLSIRREWRELSDEQRQRFLQAFERLSVTTYASRFRNLDAGMFSIDASEPLGDGRSRVLATLTTGDGEEIPFEYLLHDTGDGWKIVNILADNVSDLALKRAEYRRLLQDGSIDDLIAELERQTRDVAAD